MIAGKFLLVISVLVELVSVGFSTKYFQIILKVVQSRDLRNGDVAAKQGEGSIFSEEEDYHLPGEDHLSGELAYCSHLPYCSLFQLQIDLGTWTDKT